jgi:sulfur carrier protein ThiS
MVLVPRPLGPTSVIDAGINTEKGQLRRGQPTQIREEASIADLLRLLSAPKFRGVVSVNTELIEGAAEEISESQRPGLDDPRLAMPLCTQPRGGGLSQH